MFIIDFYNLNHPEKNPQMCISITPVQSLITIFKNEFNLTLLFLHHNHFQIQSTSFLLLGIETFVVTKKNNKTKKSDTVTKFDNVCKGTSL